METLFEWKTKKGNVLVGFYLNMYRVYCIELPDFNYIGKTYHNIETRLSQHINEAFRKRGQYSNKFHSAINEALEKGFTIKIELIERTCLLAREYYLINHYNKMGVNLLNTVKGENRHLESCKYIDYKYLIATTISNLTYAEYAIWKNS